MPDLVDGSSAFCSSFNSPLAIPDKWSDFKPEPAGQARPEPGGHPSLSNNVDAMPHFVQVTILSISAKCLRDVA
jgi:hypothetical protein